MNTPMCVIRVRYILSMDVSPTAMLGALYVAGRSEAIGRTPRMCAYLVAYPIILNPMYSFTYDVDKLHIVFGSIVLRQMIHTPTRRSAFELGWVSSRRSHLVADLGDIQKDLEIGAHWRGIYYV